VQVIHTIAEMRALRGGLARVGLVPTMGFLHEGHISLVARARAECAAVAVSIFVNPTQFGPAEDLGRYPRDLPRDLAMLEAAGADLVFAPEPAEIYPPSFDTQVLVGRITGVLEGAARPGHFAGVATVVAKLFNIVQPDVAYFGQKDAQQSVVIRKLVADLNLPVEIVVAATVRDIDGLALSSRNSYLTPAQRAAAPVLFKALTAAQASYNGGERDAERLREIMRRTISAEPEAQVEYLSLADPQTLHELARVDRQALASMAVRFGTTRLIDNLLLGA
jgi:pantoate--beta-alanine ligase